MALKKQKTNNQGITYEYFVAQAIQNILTHKTQILMCGFLNKSVRENGSLFIERIDCGIIDGLYLTGEQIYNKVKESKIIEEVETNWFADAEDC